MAQSLFFFLDIKLGHLFILDNIGNTTDRMATLCAITGISTFENEKSFVLAYCESSRVEAADGNPAKTAQISIETPLVSVLVGKWSDGVI